MRPVILLFCLAAALPAAAQHPQSLAGVWGAEKSYGPALRGALSLTRDRTGWTGRIFSRSARAPASDSVNLQFGDDGTFRGSLAHDARSIRGFWIQPPLHGATQRYASPLTLTRQAPGRWSGTVAPLRDSVAIYLDIRPGTDGQLVARLRNPGGRIRDAVFRARVASDTLRLVDANDTTRVLTGTLNARRERITIRIGAFGAFELTRRTRATAPGFYARADTSWRYRQPTARSDGWRTGSMAASGLDSLRLDSLVRRIIAVDAGLGGQPLVHSLLIARRRRLVLEEYFYGFSASTPHDLRSVSKTFASILVNVAARRGAALVPATPVLESFPQYRPFANDDPRKAQMTLAHLMTMTSGLACDENDDSSPGNEGAMQSQAAQPDWHRFALDLPMARAPGDSAVYCSAGVNLIGGMIRNASLSWLPALFDEGIARPLGLSRWYFNLMPTGEGYLGGGMHMTPRDMLKIGQLYLDRGRWAGSQVVDSAWVEESVRRHPEINAGNNDGYNWHTNMLAVGERRIAEYEANGNGGQFIIVLPEHDIVVVFTAGNYNSYGVWRRFRDEWIARYIVPLER